MNSYFLIKWLFWWRGHIDFHGIENLALAALILAPIRTQWLSSLRLALSIPIALLVLYYDTRLPPISRLIDGWGQMQGFTLTYLVELVGRLINVEMLSASLIITVAYMYISKWVRVTVLVCMGLIGSLFITSTDSPPTMTMPTSAQIRLTETNNTQGLNLDLDLELKQFYQNEQDRPSIEFIAPSDNSNAFDIIVLNICSLSWDDLDYAGLTNHPLLERFDILFNNFGSAASYSGPAAIRLLRANCGQTKHSALYEGALAQCYLFDSLQKIGFEKQWSLNHDGEYDDYKSLVEQHGQFDVNPLPLQDVPYEIESFDGTPIHKDLSVLNKWLSNRANGSSERVALFYNSITLHDGNRYIGEDSTLSSLENFHPRLNRLLTDINDFISQLERSNTNAVVIMVPEHGAAIRGDQLQIAGLREIPTPSITKVPVGIKFVGPDWHHPGLSFKIDSATSYYGLADLLSKLILVNPFQDFKSSIVEELLGNMPSYRFVSENEGVVIIENEQQYFIRLEDDEWIDYN